MASVPVPKQILHYWVTKLMKATATALMRPTSKALSANVVLVTGCCFAGRGGLVALVQPERVPGQYMAWMLAPTTAGPIETARIQHCRDEN